MRVPRRRGVDVPVAADESIRRADDPLRVVRAGGGRHRRGQGRAARRGRRGARGSPREMRAAGGRSRARWTPRSGSPPGWRSPRRCPSCPTPAGWPPVELMAGDVCSPSLVPCGARSRWRRCGGRGAAGAVGRPARAAAVVARPRGALSPSALTRQTWWFCGGQAGKPGGSVGVDGRTWWFCAGRTGNLVVLWGPGGQGALVWGGVRRPWLREGPEQEP